MVLAGPLPHQHLPAAGRRCWRRPGWCRSRQSLPVCRSSVTRSDVLLVDAQNVLSRAYADHRRGCRLPGETAAGGFADWLRFLAALAEPQLLVAVFDAPSIRRAGQTQQRQQLAPEYLQRRKRRKQAQQQPSAAATHGASTQQQQSARGGEPLRPFKREVEQLGGIALEAAGGWEADDGLAAACAAVHVRHPTARVLVASGDSDMQQLLAPLVSWVQLHSQASLDCPLGAELVTAAAFQQRFGFPPSAYPDWLALTGKKEASIKGADVGSKTAGRLLARYGSLEAVLAAATAGELKGWGPAVQRLLASRGSSDGGSGRMAITPQREAQLRRNSELFAVNADAAVLEPPGMQRLLAALDCLHPAASAAGHTAGQQSEAAASSTNASASASSSIVATPQLAWLHPLHARRRRQQLQLGGDTAHRHSSQWVATQHGLAADELLGSAMAAAPPGHHGCAIFHICPCDVTAGSWDRVVKAVQGGGCDADATSLLMPMLHGAMKHHVKLVQRAGHQVRLVVPQYALNALPS